MTSRQRTALFVLFAAVLSFQYFYNLDGTGILDPDEPRYTAIGRAMAATGDWVTPYLWGKPWFEKPVLVYWMTAAGSKAGLGVDLAGRLPVALLSVGFLVTWFFLLRREFGELAAAISTVLLATCAGWVTYSSFCLTDVPMAAFFSLAVVLALRAMRGGESVVVWAAIGASLGFAVLAKAFVPLVLFAPMAWFLRRSWRRWSIAAAALLVVAAPWFLLVVSRNGYEFIRVFFLQQQFSRLYSETLQHVQPVYFYLPVLLAVIFPWVPLLAFLRPAVLRRSERMLCLAAIVLFGLLFFSLSLNKLPGYVLPLLPSLFAVIGFAAAETKAYEKRVVVLCCAVLVALTPFAAQLTPTLLTSKISSGSALFLALLPITFGTLVLFFTPLAVGSLAHPRIAGPLLVLACSISVIQMKTSVYPVLDEQASPRGLWREIAGRRDEVCNANLHRVWEYGLALYNGRPLPGCSESPKPWMLTQKGRQRAELKAAR